MRVLLTGASGFTGRYVAARLQATGHEVLPLNADLRDAAAVSAEVAMLRPDAAIHLAAIAFVDSPDYAAFYAVNQLGTFVLLDALVAVTPRITVLIASTAQVYGGRAEGLIDEEQPLRPSNHYALSKAAMELGSALWRDRLDLIVARPFNYTGVGQEDRYLVAKIVDHFRRRAPVIELGNLHVRRDFGDVRAVADAYCRLIAEPADDRVYNVGTGVASSVGEIVATLAAITGHTIDITVNPAFVRANDIAVLAGDNRRLRRTLPCWRPYTLDETLRWMIER